jgi:hypothetical protein
VVSFDKPFTRPALVYKSSTFVPKPKEATRSLWKIIGEYVSMSRQAVDLPWNLVGRELQRKFEAANGRNQKNTADIDNLESGSSEIIERLAFDPTGRIMAFTTSFSQIYLFDIEAQRFLSYCLTVDSPSTLLPERITALCFDSPTTLVVGLFSGEVELWTLKGPQYTPPRRPETSSKPSVWFGHNHQRLLPPPGHSPPQHLPSTPDATCQRLSLIPPSLWAFHLSISTGVITHFALSPTQRTVAIATTHSGIWLYNRTTRHTHHLYLPPAGVHFTSMFWAPHATSTPLRSHTPSLSLATDTSHTAVIASTSAGQIVYFRLHDCGTRLFFHHDPLFLTHPDFTNDTAGGIAQVLFIPPTPKAIVEATRRKADLYPVLAIAMSSVPAVYIYTLRPEKHRPEKRRSLRPPVFLMSSSPDPVPLGLQRIAAVATTFAYDYGGLVRSMAMDPGGRKLLASFEHEGTTSAVWFDVGGVYGEDAEVKVVAVEEEGVGREVVFAGSGGVGGYTLAGGDGVRVVNLTTVAKRWGE